jgi:site-specific recombinase XerC
MVALLVGCGLRRSEVPALELQLVQQRHEHWVIADLLGKAGHVRTVPAIQGADGDGIVRPCASTREYSDCGERIGLGRRFDSCAAH